MEQIWSDVTLVAYPTSEEVFSSGGQSTMSKGGRNIVQPRGAQRSRNIYDSVGIVAGERLSAGLESLITPQASYWHGFANDTGYSSDPDAEEEIWHDRFRNYLFKMRYDPRSGFPLANQRAIRSMVGLGHGIIFMEEGFGNSVMATPIRYRYIPVSECFLDVNDQGMHDTCFRLYTLTAKQLCQMFGEGNLSASTRALYSKPETMDNMVQILHAVYPDKDKGNWISQYLEVENKHIIKDGFFYEFPFIVYPWLPIERSAYAESPTMLAMAELKSLQAMSKDSLIASQQAIRPPLASAYPPDVPVNMNPGAVNAKMIDPATGRLLVQPIVSSVNPSMFENIMGLRREQVKDAMYLNLWMSLSQNGVMSATEASIRAAEKGELLGPAASRVQQSLAVMIEREVAILERKGAFLASSPLAPPASLAGKKINIRFTAPIDKMRKAADAVGVQRTLETMAMISQYKPDVLDNLDEDEAIEIIRDRMGAPRSMFKTPKALQAYRDDKQQQEAMQAMTAAAQPVAAAAKDAALAAQTLQQTQSAAGRAIIPGAGA